MTPASPCINVCRMHPGAGLCEGCGRTLDEIAAWGQLDLAGRERVWRALPARQTYLRSLGVAPQPSRERS